MTPAIWVVLFLELLVFANSGSSVAPGDEEPLCGDLIAAGIALIPTYSANMRVLMDSWNYQNLLPPRTGAVWDQVDDDTNNPDGVTTNWIQISNSPCRQSVQVCGFSAGPQSNWLITQLINRTVNGMKLPQVSVTIEFEQVNCDTTLSCQRTFNTRMYETSSVDSAGARNLSNYRQVRRVSPADTSGAKANETVTIDFNTNHSSFYFAIQDETSCITVTRVIVFYSICPSQTFNLIHLTEIIVPMTGASPIPVTARCVENAETQDGSAPKLICSPGGIWSVLGSGCCCVPGYREINGTCISSYQLSCTNLDYFIANSLTTTELSCERKRDCSGFHCFNQNSLLRNFVEVFDVRLLPCMKPSPTLWLQVLGEVDPTNNQRAVVLNVNVTQNTSSDLRIEGGGITFGVYRFTANFSEANSTVGIAIQLIRNGITTQVINYTKLSLNIESCSMQTTMAPPINATPVTTPVSTTTALPPLTLPPPSEVQAHCSHVNWRNSPDVSCEKINGYDVRLFNPDTGEVVERRVDARATFHNFLQSDKDLTEQKSTTVQIRVVSFTGEGPYSSPIEVGCFEDVPEPPSVYFELKGEVYDNNSMVNILAIGEGDDALLCKTNKQDCCGTVPNRFGEFYYPNGVRVSINSARHGFYRNRGDQVIRLNRRDGITIPTGRFSCEIPDASGVTQKRFINVF